MSDGDAPDSDRQRDRWERVGRELLQEQFEEVAIGDIREAFVDARRALIEGRELSEDDVHNMRVALERAAHVVKLAAESSPETAPKPDAWNYLDEDGRKEFAEDAIRRIPGAETPTESSEREGG